MTITGNAELGTLWQAAAERSSGTSSTSIQTDMVTTCSAATQTIQLGLGPEEFAGAAASSDSSPHVSTTLEPAATVLQVVQLERELTAKHAAIAAVELQLIPHEQRKAALLVQQGAIAAQRKELNRQAAAIRAGLLATNAKLHAGHQELREARSYLQLTSAAAATQPSSGM